MEEYKVKTFNLFGEVWKAVPVKGMIRETIDGEEHTYCGMTYHGKNKIEYCVCDDKGKPFTKDTIRTTLFHELMHAIFSSGQYWNANDNENLVEWCAKCLNEIFKKRIVQ